MRFFRLVHVEGDDLRVHRFAAPDWQPGDTIPLGGGTLRVVDVDWHDEGDEVAATLTVEVVEVGRPGNWSTLTSARQQPRAQG